MIVASSDVAFATATFLQGYLNSAPSAWLCLYTNDLPLTPDTETPGSYVEASYTGYARFGTVGAWSAAIRDNPGIYHTEAGPYTFAVNASAFPVSAYGWFVLRGTRVIFAERFLAAPYIIAPMSPGPTVKVRLTQGAQSVVCPAR